MDIKTIKNKWTEILEYMKTEFIIPDAVYKTWPLLLSVRSGARASMPGMMDTILNLGMNDEAVEAVAARSGNDRFAWDSYRRFVQMYGDVVLEMKPASKQDIDPFEAIIEISRRPTPRCGRASPVENGGKL